MAPLETVIYEQCKFDWSHVSQIYRSVKSEPANDGVWQTLVYSGSDDVVYRRKGEYFQFYSGDKGSSLFQELLQLEPMPTEDDAEWTIEKTGENEYLARTIWTRTFGPVDVQGELHNLLIEYGVWLENKEHYVWGCAPFDHLNADEMWDACQRLQKLEGWCIGANRIVTQTLTDYWTTIKGLVNEQIELFGDPVLRHDPTLPGAKRRQPLPPLD